MRRRRTVEGGTPGGSARIGVDVGGTFTDLVALEPGGRVVVCKVPSTPDDPARGMLAALDRYRASPVARGAGESEAAFVLVHGTTVATNALLERTGARVVLVTTAGFEDLLWLRRQDRAALYDLARDHAPPLVDRDDVVGVDERMAPEGVVRALTEEEVTRVVGQVAAREPQAVAICLLFAFRDPTHEQRLGAALARALAPVPVVTSHEVLPVFREYERCATTTAEAFLRPVVGAYVERAAAALAERGARLRVMTSAGGALAPPAAAVRAATLALSGPAGGVIGARLTGTAAGQRDLLTLDMGGTSADAGLVLDGAVLTGASNAVGGVPLAQPAVLVETVSAGGGSIAWIDEGGALRVGPRSAGAAPGPACYGRGGTRPTVTDACMVLGWLDAEHPLAGVRLDPAAAQRAVETLVPALGAGGRHAAAGIVAVASAVMARALKRVSVARGVDPRGMTLVPFGGAGPLFGCSLADVLGMRRVLVPPHPGALSALGLAAAEERVDRAASLHRSLADLDATALADAFAPVAAAAAAELPGAALVRAADCRYAGQGYEVTVALADPSPAALRTAFIGAHRARYGHADDAAAIEVVNVRVIAVRPVPVPRLGAGGGGGATPNRRELVIGGRVVPVAVWDLDGLPAGVRIPGPAVLPGADATALIEPGWVGTAHESGALDLTREGVAA